MTLVALARFSLHFFFQNVTNKCTLLTKQVMPLLQLSFHACSKVMRKQLKYRIITLNTLYECFHSKQVIEVSQSYKNFREGLY